MGLVKIGEICNFQGGTQPPKNEWKEELLPGYIRMLQIRDFTQGKDRHIEFVKDSKKLNKCKSDDILIGRYGASVGKILTGLEGAYNVAIIKTIPDEQKIHKRYLYYFLLNPRFQSFIKNIGGRAAQQGFNKEDISDYKLFLPPLPDQIQIANILSKAENLITQRKESIRLLDEFLKSTFLEMFGDPVRNEKGWEIKNLTAFYINPKEGTKCGPFGSALKKDEYTETGIPVWTMDNILKSGEFTEKGCLFVSKSKHKELERYSTINDDIIISRAGTVGKMCIIKTNAEESIISSNLIRLRLGKKLLPIYFYSLMRYCQSRIIKLKHGNEGSYTHMSTGVLDEINFPYPPIELQSQFAQIVEKTEALKTRYQQSLHELENLYGSLSQRAFKGELKVK